MAKRTLDWHSGFQAALQVELSDDRPYLQFQEEFNLTKEPLRIDTLVIKMAPGHVIRKSIGKLFRQHNIIEYKGPDDYISINSFYKVIAYACIYQSNTKKVMEISPQEVTLTLICSHFPNRLIKHLKKQYRAAVGHEHKGVYTISGLMFPLQILLTGQLPKEEYIWLSRLRKGLDLKEDIEPLAKAYKGNSKDPLYQAAMNLIVRANHKQCEEGSKMCEALQEIFADELSRREELGLQKGIQRGIQKGIQKGETQGEERVSKLNLVLLNDKRFEDLERASKDKSYRNQLFKSLGI